jgi:hypothetical protein
MSRITRASQIRNALKRLSADASYQQVLGLIRDEFDPNITKLNPQQLSNERSKLRSPKPREITADVLKQLKALVVKLGSIAAVRKALDELEEILG